MLSKNYSVQLQHRFYEKGALVILMLIVINYLKLFFVIDLLLTPYILRGIFESVWNTAI